ncbi:MAG: isoprenylcysteine carboxylmethyltransferase family protein [Micromonosporaceae bacterium]|nr:isoprenylcysteine carboxylmethyltransferase family protein [Micromonosporaceae bacterium]
MRRFKPAIGSAVFFVVAPGTFAVLLPWLITGWRLDTPLPGWIAARVIGVLLILVGAIPLVHAFVQFARAGGTPAPVAPTRHLVVSGFNRYLRNPMYAGITVALLGQALLFGQLGLVLYAAAFWAVTAAFVHWYEEPTLRRQFGAEYEAYRRQVPAWWPRRTPVVLPGWTDPR